GPELARLAGVLGRVGVGAYADLAVAVGPRQQFLERVLEPRLLRFHGVEDHLARRAIDGDDVALAHRAASGLERPPLLAHEHVAGADDARLAHADRHHRGVRRPATPR